MSIQQRWSANGRYRATILSRCQRFDFKNIPTVRIAAHLEEVVKSENKQADADALFRIARLANGSMRDALSLLDRVLSLGDERITEKLHLSHRADYVQFCLRLGLLKTT